MMWEKWCNGWMRISLHRYYVLKWPFAKNDVRTLVQRMDENLFAAPASSV
jgi:hypothetical protein